MRAVLLVLPTQIKNLRAALACIARNGRLGLHRPFMAALAFIACMAALAVIAFIANMAVLASIASSAVSWPSLLSWQHRLQCFPGSLGFHRFKFMAALASSLSWQPEVDPSLPSLRSSFRLHCFHRCCSAQWSLLHSQGSDHRPGAE